MLFWMLRVWLLGYSFNKWGNGICRSLRDILSSSSLKQLPWGLRCVVTRQQWSLLATLYIRPGVWSIPCRGHTQFGLPPQSSGTECCRLPKRQWWPLCPVLSCGRRSSLWQDLREITASPGNLKLLSLFLDAGTSYYFCFFFYQLNFLLNACIFFSLVFKTDSTSFFFFFFLPPVINSTWNDSISWAKLVDFCFLGHQRCKEPHLQPACTECFSPVQRQILVNWNCLS